MVCFGYSGPESQAKSLPGPCAFCFWPALKLSSVSLLLPLSFRLSLCHHPVGLSYWSSCCAWMLWQQPQATDCQSFVPDASFSLAGVVSPIAASWRRGGERERLSMAGSSLSLCKLVQVRKHCERDLFPTPVSLSLIPHSIRLRLSMG